MSSEGNGEALGTSGDGMECAEVDEIQGGHEMTKEEFFGIFRTEQGAIREDLKAVSASSGDEVNQALDALLLRVQALEDSFTRAAHLLPPYDVQKYGGALKELASEIAVRREELAPRGKFSFKRRAPVAGGAEKVAGTEAAAVVSSSTASPSPQAVTGQVYEDLQGQSISCASGDLAGEDVTLRRLEGCRIVLLDRVGALHCHELRRCEIIVGAVGSSALLYSCFDCVLTLATKQLRLHDSDNMLLHLHTLSGPVVEHCKRIAFAPYDLSYASVQEHMSAASLGTASAERSAPWADVQDFNWHKRQASPNWCILPEEHRRPRAEVADAKAAAAAAPMPPACADLDRCTVLWKAVEAPPKQALPGAAERSPPPAAPAPARAEALAAPDRLDSDDEF
eukprot:CAMPEP_0183517964 /NCGR_PEP_ID=MMETSP0371-20130417/15222_1 /TAXON_ID=268820 /ORGANISM="Peridinium aciculiferum, Strain PAER-2" /LENGTH=394 /DNA_ID=CAMNT_0025715953 /DNA_START=41 /DNA_END=1225 /DNA_ORIENTATION=-